MVPKFDAITIKNHIFAKPECIGNLALIEHEKIHILQFKKDWFFPIKYLFDEQLRYKYELQAYIVKLKYIRDSGLEYITTMNTFSELLTDNYGLHKYKPDVLDDLRSALNE